MSNASARMTRQGEIQQLLRQLRTSLPSVRGVALATSDGVVIASSVPDTDDPNRLAAYAAAANALSRRFTESLQMGEFSETSIQAEGGQALVYQIDGRAILILLLWGGGLSPLIQLEARNLVQRLGSGPLARDAFRH